jgi:acyl-CoA thioester hydrolase
MTTYPLKLTLRIDWSEMDLYGHVNNVTYFKYIQAARVNYWETLGLSKMFEETRKGPILASSACNFRKPLHYPGNVTIRSGIDRIGESSFTIQHQVLNGENEVAAEATDVVVLYDFNLNKKMSVSPEMRALIERTEGGQ